jgi:two-component sensor histidine kinase
VGRRQPAADLRRGAEPLCAGQQCRHRRRGDITLSPNAAQSYSNVIHELTTNAAKYGALSRAGGKVDLKIEATNSGREEAIVLTWKESGGPPVREPDRRGFGLSVIQDVLRYEFDAKVDVTFDPSGLTCRIEALAKRISSSA